MARLWRSAIVLRTNCCTNGTFGAVPLIGSVQNAVLITLHPIKVPIYMPECRKREGTPSGMGDKTYRKIGTGYA